MKEEIVKTIVSNDQYIKTLFEIQKEDIVDSVKRELVLKLKNQMSELGQEFPLRLDFEETLGTLNDETYITFYLKDSKKGFYICFGFCRYFSGMFYVVDCDKVYFNECKEEVGRRLGNSSLKDCIWGNWFEDELSNWDSSPEPWLFILNGRLKENIKGKIENILRCLEGFEM